MVYRHLGLPCRKSKVGTHDDMDSDWRPLVCTGNKPPPLTSLAGSRGKERVPLAQLLGKKGHNTCWVDK